MLVTRIEKIGDSAALFLTDEMLKLLNVNYGDELEVSVEPNREFIRIARNGSKLKHRIEKAAENVLKRRESVYIKLAEGVSEKE
ncbi:MAG: hypothetical protein JRJ49_04710 [Deltaproteobacteria bacterium]|jgi:putative addiction module antidote|nr:hypothetical protein [Deltaproteobacteria bacterium]